MQAASAHTVACPVPLSEFQLRQSHPDAVRPRVLVGLDDRLAPRHCPDVTDIFQQVRFPVLVDHRDAAGRLDEFVPEPPMDDNFVARPDEAVRQPAALPDELDIAVLAGESPQVAQLQPLPAEREAQDAKPDSLAPASQVVQAQRVASPQALRASPEQPAHHLRELPRASPQP